MILTFLGVGEAFGQFANTSILIDGKILLDCGPHTLLQLRKLEQDLKEIKLVFLSHFHGDHTLGLPVFLLASREEEREEKLKIFGPSGLREKIADLLELLYDKSFECLHFELETFEIPDLNDAQNTEITSSNSLRPHTQSNATRLQFQIQKPVKK